MLRWMSDHTKNKENENACQSLEIAMIDDKHDMEPNIALE